MGKNTRKTNDTIIEKQLNTVETELKDGVFIFSSPMSINDFALKLKRSPTEIITHYFKQGKMFNINHILSEEQIAELCLEFGYDFQKESETNAQNFMENVEINDAEKDLKSRPPIITIMGHVDHGKTTLIDKIRNSNIASSEAGSITQHTGAYQVEFKGKKITFLDTPGHEAFTAMRARGAKLTDIVVLVVAADDGVKPQTKEAVVHAKAAKAPIIVFVNKMDKNTANPEKVKTELAAIDVVCEEWGGDTQFVYGSGLSGDGIEDLFMKINLQAEILELKANPDRMAIGIVVESRIDKGLGPVATIIIENGTLHTKDFIVAGSNYGRVRSMQNSKLKHIEYAPPGTPVLISGINYTPKAGDKFFAFHDEKFAKSLAIKKQKMDKVDELRGRSILEVEDGVKVLNIIIKADVQGTAEAVKYSLSKLDNEEAKVRVISSTVGEITRSDILLAQASNGIISTFNIKPTPEIKSLAEEQKIDIRTYKIIYKMIEDVELMLNNMKAPKFEEKIIGHAQIQKIIFFSKVGNIAGCVMLDGKINNTSYVRIFRKDKLIFEGKLDSLQRGKNAAKTVDNGKDFGCHIKGLDDIRIDDVIESYEMVEVK